MTRTRRALLCAATLITATLQTTATATAAGAGPATVRGHGEHACVSTPQPVRGQARRVLETVRKAQQDLDLKSVEFKVTVDGKELITDALGESMTGVPAEPDMNFRAGSVGIAYMATVLLQLVQEGRVGLDDPISRWLPDAPHAREITLRELGSSTSGLHDYVTDPVFLAELAAHPFKQWTPEEVVGISAGHPLWYRPGTNWSYSHANFQLLGAALERITGTPLDQLLRERVIEPLGLDSTANSFTPEIPAPVLHAFTSERGLYEESTFWNPSWTTAPGAVITTDICDLARSAQAIGSGELLSRRSFRVQLDPGTVGLGHPTDTCPPDVCLPNTEARHFGFGIIVSNDWVVQNPSFSGYAAIQAYLPGKRLAIAVSSTKGPDSPANVNTAEIVAERISELLSPDNPLTV
ncbi:serine hydrolase domain-containing protein [Kitasatospora sp. NPDC059571]|uniref:serine hydrolase domain-containing protein n=1 Tax=Kitasatospora sp. NPDC059571 TaxID=3346871 RepID=UPI0036B22596